MYQSFSILGATPDLKNKQIIIEANQEIYDGDCSDLEIQLFERRTRTPMLFDVSVEDKFLIIALKDWPLPNSEYILGIKGLKNVLGEETDLGNLKTKILFKSEITSKVEVLSPTKFEKIDELVIKLKETNNDPEQIKNCFYIEIAKDNAFIDSPYQFYVRDKNIVPIQLSNPGQYFMRARVQVNNNDSVQYGEWSELITFVYGKEKEEGEIPPSFDPEDIFDDATPEVQEDILEITALPQQGESGESFIFEFNMPLDEFFSGKDIIIIRRDVK